MSKAERQRLWQRCEAEQATAPTYYEVLSARFKALTAQRIAREQAVGQLGEWRRIVAGMCADLGVQVDWD